MKMPVALFLLLALSNLLINSNGEVSHGICSDLKLEPRPHSVSISEFGAVGDGKTLNTLAFQNAIFYLKSFADKGGAQLYVPPGKWLTGSINLTSHLTLFLEKGAVILGSPDPSSWDIVDPLPSYGRGIELPGKRYRSLINGYMLYDVVITGNNGTIDGQGAVWWERYNSGALNYTRPQLVEFVSSKYVVVSNLTFLNAPANNIHPVYCSHVHIQNVSIKAPLESPRTSGIVPDSSNNVCIEDSIIQMGHDAISLKSGWDEYGIQYGQPTMHTHIRRLVLQSSSGSGISLGSEMSGGISNINIEQIHFHNSLAGISFRTTKGRGGFITNVTVSDTELENVNTAFVADGYSGSHPDDKYDPDELPFVSQILLENIRGKNIGLAGNFTGIKESPFKSICLLDINLSVRSSSSGSWICSHVSGYSESVFPEPCPDLKSSSTCFSSDSTVYGTAAAF